MTDSPYTYYEIWVIQCNTFWVTISGLFRGAHHLGPRYLADNVRKEKCTHYGYMTRLSMLRTLDLPSTVAVPRGDHLVAQDPGQERNHASQAECRYLKEALSRQDRTMQTRNKIGGTEKPCEEILGNNTKLKDNFMKELRTE
jgi:hypothetical protein